MEDRTFKCNNCKNEIGLFDIHHLSGTEIIDPYSGIRFDTGKNYCEQCYKQIVGDLLTEKNSKISPKKDGISIKTTKQKRYIDSNGYERGEVEHSDLISRQLAYYGIYLKNRDKYPLPFSQYQVHHIDRDKRNNKVSNLQIVTKEEHERIHGIKTIVIPDTYGTGEHKILPSKDEEKPLLDLEKIIKWIKSEPYKTTGLIILICVFVYILIYQHTALSQVIGKITSFIMWLIAKILYIAFIGFIIYIIFKAWLKK